MRVLKLGLTELARSDVSGVLLLIRACELIKSLVVEKRLDLMNFGAALINQLIRLGFLNYCGLLVILGITKV